MTRAFGPDWKYLTADGDLNFHGSVKKYFEIINKDVLEYIKDIYYRTYLNIIFPLISQDVALIDFDYDHIDRILKLIQNERGLLDQTIKSDYRHLVIDPYEYFIKDLADKSFDPSYGASYKLYIPEGDSVESAILLIPKSFSLKEDEKARKYFLSCAEEKGEIVGLAVMYFIGARENEICGLCFKDIKEMKRHPGVYYVNVGYKTTIINSNQLKAGGKTPNAPRRLVLLPEQYRFLKRRMEYIESKTGASCLDLPISCRDDHYDVRCSTNDLSVEGKCFFEHIMKMRGEEISAAATEMMLNEDNEFYEEDPTTYFLRRNLATKLYIHDLTIDECQYYMGHEIDSRRVLRSDFSDEDMLYSIYKKLLNDPLSDICLL